MVDSSEALVNLTCETLKSDYDTLMCFNGADAVAQYKSLRPDLVVMEVEMEGVDGFEACRQIKEYAGRRFIPIIFTSNNSDLQSIKKGLQNGAEDYLGKPFEQEELFVRIQATLRTKKLYTQLMQAYEIIENERNIVGEIQQSLLCENPSTISGFNFFSKYQPSSKAGGDYFDFIQIDDDHLGVLVADVSGHGTPAAVIMAMKRILLRSFLSKIRSPRETLEKLNSILCENVRSGHFITAFYGVIHLPTRSMKYASAGHNPPILVDYNTGDVRELWADTGFPLMISPENIMAEHEVQLHPNSKLVLYTDGLTEAKNHQEVVYGFKQLADSVSQLGENLDAEGLGQKLLEEIQNFMDGAPFHGDLFISRKSERARCFDRLSMTV